MKHKQSSSDYPQAETNTEQTKTNQGTTAEQQENPQSTAPETSQPQQTEQPQGDNTDTVPEEDPLLTYKERKNQYVDPNKFSQERAGTHDQETEEEFINPGEPDPSDDDEAPSSGKADFNATKGVLKLSAFGLSKWHQKNVFTSEERARLKKLRRITSEKDISSEEDKTLYKEFKAVKKQEKEELEFDKEEIEMITEPLSEVLANSNFKLKPEYSLLIAVSALMLPRILFVLNN